jgi:hypothetical protein
MQPTARRSDCASLPTTRRSRVAEVVFGVVVVGLAAAPRSALAQAVPSLELSWSAPPECPDAASVQRAVAGYLQNDRPEHALRAEANLVHLPEGSYTLTLRVAGTDARAERTLSGADCGALSQAGALLIAIALDPALDMQPVARAHPAPPNTPVQPAPGGGRAPAAPESGPAPAAPTAAIPTATQAPEPHMSPSRAATEPPRWGAALGFLLDVGAVPALGLGLVGALELRVHAVRLSLGAQGLLPRERDVPTLSQGNVQIGAAAGLAQACISLLPKHTLEVSPCALLELGVLWGSAHGIASPSHGRAFWLAPGPGVEARTQLGAGWALVAHAAVLIPYARRSFFVRTETGDVSAYRVSAAVLRTGLGIAYEFR